VSAICVTLAVTVCHLVGVKKTFGRKGNVKCYAPPGSMRSSPVLDITREDPFLTLQTRDSVPVRNLGAKDVNNIVKVKLILKA